MIEHNPGRPSWDCRACGQPWPCAPAREAMSSEFKNFPTVLRIYLVAQMTDAARDVSGIQPPELYARFLDWSR